MKSTTRSLASATAGPRAFLEKFDHDLRTPLGTMVAAVELLRDEPVGTRMHADSLAVLQRQIEKVNSLTDALREYAQTLDP